MARHIDRDRAVQRTVQAGLRRIERKVGEDLTQLRIDAGATKAEVARVAAVDRTFIGRVEAGEANPSLETLVAYATALGADLSVRVFGGTGPRLTDRHQARMVECVLRDLHPVWRPHIEVPVSHPARGVIDAVFDRRDQPLFVISEFQSTLPRLEQQIRWMAAKASAIGSSDLVGPGPIPPISRLLVLRSTNATRKIASQFESTLRAAYPAPARAAVNSLRNGTPWPGDSLIWVRIEGDLVEVMDGPPRGVALGR
jgi:transcriptional regulator with XRE-family HTH domain